MNIRSKGLLKILTSLFLFNIFISVAPTEQVSANFEPYYNQCVTDSKDGEKANSDGESTGNSAAVTGDWTKKGTKAYSIAKETFDGWVEVKMSGAQSAGIVGNIGGAENTSWVLDLKEFGGGSGGGLYQFTPYTKYLNDAKSDKSWSVKNQRDVVMHLEPQTVQAFFNATKSASPEEAAEKWEVMYERPASVGATLKARQNAARKAYELFGGANISAGSAISGANSAVDNGQVEQQKKDPCNTLTSTGNSDGGIVDVAKSLLGYFHYDQIHGESQIGSVDSPDKDGRTDCSGFVWLVLTKAGYKTPKNMSWFTMPMEDDAKKDHKWLEEISESEAGPGDVVIVNTGNGSGSAGHTAILEEKWKGDKTKVIQMGGISNSGGVNESTFKESFLSLLNNGKPVFARTVKK